MRPTLQQKADFLFQTYFGTKGDELDRFISRAYRDMSRTLNGIGKLEDADKSRIYGGGKKFIREGFEDLEGLTFPSDKTQAVKEFEYWHSNLCSVLLTHYGSQLKKLAGISMTYGQAQKWINMTIKYCWSCGGNSLDGIAPWYEVAHIAVDQVILVAAEKTATVSHRPCKKWSKWNNEPEYLEFQKRIREKATSGKQTPLEMEYDWWLKFRPSVTGDDEED